MPEWFASAIEDLLDFSNILNASIAASWMVLAVIILRFLLKKAPRWTHVALWGLVAVRMLLPFSIESAFSLIPSKETIPHEILVYEGTQLKESAFLDVVSNPVFSGSVTAELGKTVDRVQISLVKMNLIWIVGIAVLLLYTAASYWRLRRRVSEATILRGNIYQSENIASPFVLGIIKPKIYLPYGINEKDLGHVVAHEQVHIQRRDHWWKPLGFFLLTIHWFNPLMWLAYVLLCRDIELACDEKVIKELGDEQRADYTQALVVCSVSRRSIAACPLAFGEVGVKERVKSVMNYKKPAFWIVLLSILACAVVAVCFLTDPKVSPDFGNVVSVCVGDDQTPVSDEGRARLIELLERYRKDGFPVGWDDPNLDSIPVQIRFSDGSDCLLHYYYYNGFSLDKLLNREGNFYAILTYWAHDGSVDAWKMEEDFNADFEHWYGEYYAQIPVTNPNPMDDTVPDPESGEDPESNADPEAEKLFDLDEAISAAILSRYASEEPDGLIHMESHVLLTTETVSGTPLFSADDHAEKVTAYLLVHHVKYSTYGGTLEAVGGSYVPTAVTFKVTESGKYILEAYWEPRDGIYYADDIRKKFPGEDVSDALNDQAYIVELKTENYNKALAYLESNRSLDAMIEELLGEIQSSPAHSSNPGDYIREHETEYNELLGYGEYTLRYCFAEFLQGSQYDLRGHIMASVCEDIMLSWGEAYTIDGTLFTGQDRFNEFRRNAESLAVQYSPEALEKTYPGAFLLLQMMDDTMTPR